MASGFNRNERIKCLRVKAQVLKTQTFGKIGII
jgi:hypothetical protein